MIIVILIVLTMNKRTAMSVIVLHDYSRKRCTIGSFSATAGLLVMIYHDHSSYSVNMLFDTPTVW